MPEHPLPPPPRKICPEKLSQKLSSPRKSPPVENPPKKFRIFLNSKHCMWTMAKLHNLQLFLQELWLGLRGPFHPQRHNYQTFELCWIRWLSKKFPIDFGEKGAWPSNLFGHLKKGTRTFDYGSNEPSIDLLGSLAPYDQPLEKQKDNKKTNKTNMHP